MIKETQTTVFGIIVILFLGSVIPIQLHAQEACTSDEYQDETSFKFKHLLQDQGAIWTAPFHGTTKDLVFWGPAVAGTALIILHDEKIFQNVKNFQEKNGWVDKISPHITKLGDGDIHLGILATLYLGGLLFKDDKLRETGGLCLQTLFHTAIVVNVLKHCFGRQRPDYGDGKDGWHGLSDSIARYTDNPQSRYNAFPSGHTIIVWGSATVVSEQYKESLVIPIVCYSLATLVGLSRMTESRHWLSDAVAGAVLGHAIGKYIARKRSSCFRAMPALSRNRMAMIMTYQF